jgi:hypothetical protein
VSSAWYGTAAEGADAAWPADVDGTATAGGVLL